MAEFGIYTAQISINEAYIPYVDKISQPAIRF
jgi:hypothetical protein